jgi:Calpain family cysteine protease
MDFDQIFANAIDLSSTILETSLDSKSTNPSNTLDSPRLEPIEIPLDPNDDFILSEFQLGGEISQPDIVQGLIDDPFLGPKLGFSYKKDGIVFNGNYEPVAGTLFGIDQWTKDARISDIRQGQFGDCAFVAALASTFSAQNIEKGASSSVIESMVRPNADGTFSFRFYDDKKQEYWVAINPKSAFTVTSENTDGKNFFFGANGAPRDNRFEENPNNPNNILWVSLAEKAYAKFRQHRIAMGGGKKGGWNAIGNGDTVVKALNRITPRQVESINIGASGISFSDLDARLNQEFITAGTGSDDVESPTSKQPLALNPKLVEGHAYALTDAYYDPLTGAPHVVVYNPWGRDGGKTASGEANDGFIDVTWQEFLGSFNYMAIA